MPRTQPRGTLHARVLPPVPPVAPRTGGDRAPVFFHSLPPPRPCETSVPDRHEDLLDAAAPWSCPGVREPGPAFRTRRRPHCVQRGAVGNRSRTGTASSRRIRLSL